MNTDAESERVTALVRCPACGTLADGPRCPACGILLASQQAAELRWIEAESRRIDEARTWLLNRRAVLLAELVQASVNEASRTTTPQAEAVQPAAIGTQRAKHELSSRTVGRLLLAAGAILVVIGSTVFTVANWSSLGPLGRCAILLAVTTVVLVAPMWLKRRALSATAETVASIGLALTIADGYLTQRLMPTNALSDATKLFLVAAASAALAVSWAAYGLAVRLRAPQLAAIVAAQLPGVITTVALVRALGGTSIAGPIALALVLTSAADLLVSGWTRRRARSAVALTSSIAATVTWVAAILLAVTALLENQAGSSVVRWMSGVLVTAAVVSVGILPGNAVSWLPVTPIATISGGLLGIGLALSAIGTLRPGWEIVSFALAGAVVAAAALLLARVVSRAEPGEQGERSPALGARLRLVAAGSSTITAAAGLIEVPAAVSAMFPLRRLTDVWSGPPFPRPSFVVSYVSGAPVPATVLLLVSLVCWLAPVSRESRMRSAALAFAALSVGSLPAAGLTGWTALAVLTTAAAVMLGGSMLISSAESRMVAIAATCSGVALALSAMLWSLTWTTATVTELAVLTAMFCLVAVSAGAPGQLATACAVAAATGLACAVSLASGWSAPRAAFAVLAVAVVALGIATLLVRARPRQSAVLDAGAGLVTLVAAAMAARYSGTFAVIAAIAALTATALAWLRSGRRKLVVLCGAIFAAFAAIAAEGRPLILALARPYTQLAAPWHRVAQAAVSGLPLAAVVAGACAVAMVTAAGAWRGRQASLDAAALALPVLAMPGALAGGLSYAFIVVLLLVVAVAMTVWASASQSLAPAAAAVAANMFAVAWALAAPAPTVIVLGCLSAAYPLCGWRARRADVRFASSCLSVLSAAALAEAAALAAGWPAWQAGLAVLGVAAIAHITAGLLDSARLRADQQASSSRLAGQGNVPPAASAIEAAAWLAVVVGTVQCLSRPGPASAALAISGLLCIGVAIRANRRPALWVGAGLCQAAWVVWLLAAGVSTPEPYTVPAAVAWIAYSWYLTRNRPQLRSWWTYGPGLALLLLPSLTAVWTGPGWIRPLALGLAAAAITFTGARLRLQAPLLIGAAVAALDAGHELAPAIRRVALTVPTWVPIAVTGAVLLWAGATYEARLRNLSTLRKVVGAMR